MYALFESASYSYYTLSDTPSYYKEATVNADGSLSFSEVKGTEPTTLTNATTEFSTSSRYGDYQLDITSEDLKNVNTVYGVVVSTKEGSSYGLRHVENIWKKTKLAWSTGFVTESHGNTLDSKDYAAMMGQTINKVTYYTDQGIYEIPMDQQVAKKFDGEVSVADVSVKSEKTAITVSGLPNDFEEEYKIDAIKGTYLDNYRDMWDLYINNSTCDPKDLAAKTGDDARNEFLNKKAVFYQNGTWEYTQLIDGGLTDDDMTMLPVYFGVGDEANQGLCTGTENYWCVNKDADEADIQATLDFMDWCVTSDEGTKCMADDMGFNIPFKKAQESKNLFIKEDKQMTEDGKTPVAWNFSTMPSEEWKNGVGSALTAYAADQTDANWDAVVSAFVDGWASEYKLANE